MQRQFLRKASLKGRFQLSGVSCDAVAEFMRYV